MELPPNHIIFLTLKSYTFQTHCTQRPYNVFETSMSSVCGYGVAIQLNFRMC